MRAIEAKSEWNSCGLVLPPEGQVVETKIDDHLQWVGV